MKRRLFTFALAALTIGLLGSCSKINERIDDLDKRVYDLENNRIASVEQQITAINTSINELKAADVTINGKIADLKTTADAQQALIDALQEADRALGQKDTELEARIATLEGQVTIIKGQIATLEDADKAINLRIDSLKTYVDTEIGKTKDWAEETFATFEQYQQTAENLAKLSVTVTGISNTLTGIQTSISGLDTKIDVLDADLQGKIIAAKTELEGKITSLKTELKDEIASAITESETSIKSWINDELLEGYYKAAVVDEKINALNTVLEASKSTAKTRIDSLATELTKTKAAVDTAKANIRTEYKNAIDVAINKLDGEIRGALLDSIAAVNARIEALDTRVTTLEGKVLALEGKVDKLLAMIQSVSITPAYSDGSVEAVNGILTLKCIVSPAEALIGMESLKDSLLIYADSVKVKTKATTPAYMTIKVSKASVLDAAQGAITLTADISEYLPKGEDKALTVAVNIKNGISDFTTEFVPVTVAAANPIVAYVEIAAKYDGSTVSTLRWYRQSLAITGSGKKAWTDDSGSPVKVPGTDEDVVVGDYFQWGTFTGFYGNGAGTDKGLLPYTSFTSTGCGDGSDAFTFKDGKQFNQTNAPYWSGSAYTKYNATDKKTELDASDDVASIILGGTWRMPTTKEFQALKEVTYWAWDATDKGYYVYTPNPASDAGKVNDGTGTYNKADALLFFPVAGNGYEDTYYDAGYLGDFWTGSLNSANPAKGCILYLNGGEGRIDAASNDSERYRGYSVRPVQDPKATYKAVTSVSLNETSKNITVGGNLQLKATVIPDDATQQGVYWTSSAPTVATVDATGKVIAVAAGTATITATTVDGSKTTTCVVKVSETKTMADILKTTTGIPESQNLTPPANAWVNSTDPDCKAFVGIDAEGDKLFVIKKEGSGLAPLGICMDDAFARIDDNTYQRIEPSVGTFTIKMAEGKFTSYEFTAASGSASEQFNGTYSAPAAPTEYTVTFDLNGISGTAPEAQKIEENSKVTKPTDPTDMVHTFAGWYKTKDATTGALSDPWDFDNDIVTADMTLYAKWTKSMKDLLGNDFPKSTTNSAPENAWTNEKGYKAFIYGSDKYFKLDPGNANGVACLTSNQFTRISDGKYVFIYVNGSANYGVFTLNIEDSTLVSIEYDGTGTKYVEFSGTYAAPTAK